MIILAIDLATDRLSVAVSADERVAERHLVGARGHAGAVVPLIDAALGEVGATVAGVERVVVADGPGSFTGLRVAAALAKGLVVAGGASLAAAPSLLGRAWGAVDGGEGLVLAAASALRGEVYAGWYRFPANGGVIVERAAVAQNWTRVSEGTRPDVIVGDGPDDFLESLGRRWEVPVVPREVGVADARHLLALDRRGGTVPVAAPSEWEPVYGRPAEAQARWERDHGRPLPDPDRSPG